MMIGISPVSHVHRYVKERYYPGSGYGGITANSDSIAFYSHVRLYIVTFLILLGRSHISYWRCHKSSARHE